MNGIHENIKTSQQYKNIFKNSTICPSKHATSDNIHSHFRAEKNTDLHLQYNFVQHRLILRTRLT